MADPAPKDSADQVLFDLRTQALEFKLAALESERQRIAAKFDRHIEQARMAIEQAGTAHNEAGSTPPERTVKTRRGVAKKGSAAARQARVSSKRTARSDTRKK